MKQIVYYECQNCGAQTPRWVGKCSVCGQWNTLEKVKLSPTVSRKTSSKLPSLVTLKSVNSNALKRISLGIGEWDAVIGGGLVAGQVLLLAGEPGVGKSTLLLTIANSFQGKIVYFAGEESVAQISRRARRLGFSLDNVGFVPSGTAVDSLIALLEREKPDLLLVDSIQTLLDLSVGSSAGSLAQTRAVCQKLAQFAKKEQVTTILVGHINKEGNVAGPKVLEHIVDTSLFMEGEKHRSLRFLRCLKNRFGAVDEVGIFSMGDSGLREVKDTNELFLGKRSAVAGSCLAVVMEGTRPMLVEAQALTLPCRFGYPKRSASGVSLSRLQTLLAVIEKRLNINLQAVDVYISVAGGLKINEPALDLPVCLAVISAIKNKKLSPKLASFGEVGLGGEIRPVARETKRLRHAQKMGIDKIIFGKPYQSLQEIISDGII